MMENIKDILADRPELKKMPYSMPAGYLESFKSQIKPSSRMYGHVTFRERIVPYLSLAAVFVFIVAAGTFFLQHSSAEEFTHEDYLVFSTYMTDDGYFEESGQLADAGIDDEDIIEYLIYSGISAEEIELSK